MPIVRDPGSYWCYRCRRLVTISSSPNSIVCPDCNSGFLEQAETPPILSLNLPPTLPPSPPLPSLPNSEPTRTRRFPTTVMWVETSQSRASGGTGGRHNHNLLSSSNRRSRRTGSVGDRSPVNPVIVFRSPVDAPAGGVDGERQIGNFELYYDDGTGSGLRPLSASMSDFLMGSGFDRLLDQLAQIELNGIGGRSLEHPHASKEAVESMPTIEIVADHIAFDSPCAVCMELFVVGAEAREMPCKHFYHQECILPWLSMRNSCPVCRYEMPTDVRGGREEVAPESDSHNNEENVNANTTVGGGRGGQEEVVGLTIWRLPGGGFAVGRFSGGRRSGEREMPVVYTEMDGGFNNSGVPRRISWNLRSSRSRDSSGIGYAVRTMLTFFGRHSHRSSSSSSSSSSSTRVNNSPTAISSSSSSMFRRSWSSSFFARRSSRRSRRSSNNGD